MHVVHPSLPRRRFLFFFNILTLSQLKWSDSGCKQEVEKKSQYNNHPQGDVMDIEDRTQDATLTEKDKTGGEKTTKLILSLVINS